MLYLLNVYLLNVYLVTKTVTTMYDTIGLRLNGAICNTESLENLRDIYIPQTGANNIVGNLRNLRVAQYACSVSISGSLPKFINGNNLKSITKADTSLAIQEISDNLEVPVGEADVFKVHIANNFEVELPVAAYISCFGRTNRYKMLPYPATGVIYRNRTRALEFYDKLEEMKYKKQKIPGEFLDIKLLRYELKLNKNVKRDMKFVNLQASDLSNEEIFKAFIKRWRNEYMRVSKKKDIKFKVKLESLTPRELIKHFALQGIHSLGGIK